MPGGGYIYPAYDLNHAFEDTDVFMSMASSRIMRPAADAVAEELPREFARVVYGDDKVASRTKAQPADAPSTR